MMSGMGQPLLPYGNGGFGHEDEVTIPTAEFPQAFKIPSPPRESLLCPDYLIKALAGAKHLRHADTEYIENELELEPVSVKKEPNWVNNNPGAVYTNIVDDRNMGGLGSIDNDKFQDDVSCNIFVGNLPLDCSESKLYDLFSDYGNVIDARVAKKYDIDRQIPGFAFVKFFDATSVTRVLDSKPIKLNGGHRLNVQRKEFWKVKRCDGDDDSKKYPSKSRSSPIRQQHDLDFRKSRSRSRSKIRRRRKRSSSISPLPRRSERRRSRSQSGRSRTPIWEQKRRRRFRSSQERPRRQRSNSIFSEAHRKKLREEREYELERLRHVSRREERLREDERRLKEAIEGGKLRAEEEQVRRLKRERLAREKKLHERERSLLRLKEEQEHRKIKPRRSVSRDRHLPERHVRMRSRSRRRSRSRGSLKRGKSGSEVSSSSRQTSSSRSVFDGNRLGDKVSVKTRLGKRRRSLSGCRD